MDLIEEYYHQKGYDYELLKRLELKQKKIVSWQKNFKTKTKTSVATKKFSKLKLKISQLSLIRENASNISEVEPKPYKNVYSDAVLSFHERPREEVMCWRLPRAPSKVLKSTSPIDKFEYFENKIRKNFHKKYERYFPDSYGVLEDVLNLMFSSADNSFTETVKVNSKQIKVVPDATAKYLNMRVALLDEINKLVEKDVETSKKCSMLPKSAFGKTFQNNFKIESKSNNFKTRWQGYSLAPGHHQDLESFAAVWKNITHLQSTRKFCMWLANNTNVTPPAFLERHGLLKDKVSLDFSTSSESFLYEYIAPQEIIERPYRRSTHKSVQDNTSSNSSSRSSLGSVDISDINIIV